MLFFLFRELLEDAATSRVAGDARGAGVEIEPAPFGRNRDPKRVAREQELRHTFFGDLRPTRLAALAGAMDLQHALSWREAARGRDLLDKRLDVGAQELERPVAGLADQMEVPGMPVRMLEPEAALAEIDFPGNPGVDHPLERPVDSRAADPLILALDQIDQIVGCQVTLLAEEHVDDEIAFAGTLAACRTQAVDVGGSGVHEVQRSRASSVRRPSWMLLSEPMATVTPNVEPLATPLR